MTHLILIRHGETAWTRERRYQGNSDTPLNARGRREARALARWLCGYRIDALYTSTLSRARATGEIVSHAARRKIKTDSRLNELAFGKWEGRTAAELLAGKDPAYRKWCAGKLVSPPGGEKFADFRRRTGEFLRDVLKDNPRKTTAIISHGGVVKMFLFHALRLPLRSLWTFRIDTGSISILSVYPHFIQCAAVNDISHLGKPHELG